MSTESASGHHIFPSPVGGVPFALDFAPSILFAILYALLAPIALYRGVSRKSRTIVFIAGAMLVAIHNVVDFVLRSLEAHDPSYRTSGRLIRYFQTAYAVAPVAMGHTIFGLLRCFLLSAAENDTPLADIKGDIELQEQPLEKSGEQASVTSKLPLASSDSKPPDMNRLRKIQYTCHCIEPLFITAMILGIVQGAIYTDAEGSFSKARTVQLLRYISSAAGLALLQGTNITALWVWRTNPSVVRSHALFISVMACLLSVTLIYRLVVMRFKTYALQSHEPGSLNSTTSKATFYIFHILPEFVCVISFLSVNLRVMYNTGFLGRKFKIRGGR